MQRVVEDKLDINIQFELALVTADKRRDQNEQNNSRNNITNDSNSLPAEIIPIILSYCCHSLRRVAKFSRVCKSWREALSRTRIERLYILLRRSNYCKDMMKFAASHLKDVADLSIYSRKDEVSSVNWIEVGKFVRSCSSKVEHFSYFEKGPITWEKHVLDDVFVSLQDASKLESLTFSNTSLGNIDFIQQILENKSRLRTLKLENITISESFPDAGRLQSFWAQIGKCHELRELQITSYFDTLRFQSLDVSSLLSGLKELKHLHVCNPSIDSLLAIHRYCPTLNRLDIADYNNHDRLGFDGLLAYLRLSSIQALDISSSLYGDEDDAVSITDVQELCRASKTLRTLIVTIAASRDNPESAYKSAAVEASNGRILLKVEKVLFG